MPNDQSTGQFHNVPVARLADELGTLDCEVKALETRMAALKAELKARAVARAEGERFTVTRSDAVRWSLDIAGIKSEMGEAWANARSKVAAVTSFRVSVNRAALAA